MKSPKHGEVWLIDLGFEASQVSTLEATVKRWLGLA